MRSTACLAILLFLICRSSPVYAQSGSADSLGVALESLLDQRVTAAAKYEQRVRDAPASVTIITSEEIEHYGYKSLGDVLQSVRGFYLSNDRNYLYAGVRGFGRPGDYNNRLLLLLDGHSLNENVYGSAWLDTELGGLDLGMVERIEIVRGPGSALYGTNAMLAVINIVMKEPKSASSFRLEVESGSYGALGGSAALARVFENGLELLVSARGATVDGPDLYFPEFDDPSTNNGVAEDLDWDEYYGVFATLKFNDLQLKGLITSRDKGIPTAAWGVDFNNDDAWTEDGHAFADLKYDRELGTKHNVMLRTYVDHYKYEGSYPFDGNNQLDGSEGNWLGAEFQYRWDVRSNNRLIAGVEYQDHLRSDYRLWDADTTYFAMNVPFNVFSFYAEDEFEPTDRVSVVAGLRRDDCSTSGAETSPRAAVILTPFSAASVKLLYGEAFRVPTFFERYYEDLSSFKSNQDLDPERTRTYELSWEQQLRRTLRGVVSIYQNDMEDLIDIVIDPSDSLAHHENIGRARARGIELELNGMVGRLNGYGSYTFQDAEDWKTRSRLTNSPSHLAKFGMVFPIVERLYGAVEAQYETERKTVYGTKTDAFFLAHLKLTEVLDLFGARSTVSLQVRNVFDETYRTPGGFEHIQPAITQNGRTLLMSLDTKF